jgi:hypothetical protein
MLPADTPRLPKWPFLTGDAALLGLAWWIASESRNPFVGTPFIAIVCCVALGAVLAVVPFLTDYARKQDEALDERQRALEALSRTVATSAEQISIAAGGLHEIATLAQRNLQAAEQLPEKLQEKIAGFKNQLAGTRDSERDELKKELARLRTSEAERLQAATDKLSQAIAALAKLELSTRQLLAARPEPLVEQVQPGSVAETRPAIDPAVPASPAEISGAPAAESPPPPRRTRKPRTEPPAAPVPATEAGSAAAATTSEMSVPAPILAEPPPIATAIPEIVPVAPDSTPPIEPLAIALPLAEVAPPPVAAADASVPEVAQADHPAKPERKRAPRKPRPDLSAADDSSMAPAATAPDEPSLGLEVAPEPAEVPAPVERVVSSDGATRLLVTAYIGIGNRLFIRGAGPGLSWSKGLPLQFVSIGKWRWETSDASGPVQYKLYKNDDIESAAVGLQTLDPGQQQEVTATFP